MNLGMPVSSYINPHDWVVGNIISDNREAVNCVNGTSGTAEVFTITVDTGTASATYTAYLNGTLWSYVNGAATNTTTIATAIRDDLRRNPALRDIWTFESAANVVTATFKKIGKVVTCSTTDAKLTVANTVNASTPAAIQFGEPVFAVPGTSDAQTGALFAKPLNSTTFTLQTFEITLTYASGAVVLVTGDIDGYGKVGTASMMVTDLATSRTALIADLQAEIPSTFFTIAAHGSVASKITVTATNYGIHGKFSAFGGDAGAKATIAETTLTSATDASKRFIGIVPRNEAAYASNTEMGYAYNRAFAALQKGKIIVPFYGPVPKFGDEVYYDYVNKRYVTSLVSGAVVLASGVAYISGLVFEAVNAEGTMAAIRVRD